VMNLALADEVEEARRAVQTLKHLAPGISQRWLRQSSVWASGEETKKYVEAFRLAGLA
jgi:hypothetical protein